MSGNLKTSQAFFIIVYKNTARASLSNVFLDLLLTNREEVGINVAAKGNLGYSN